MRARQTISPTISAEDKATVVAEIKGLIKPKEQSVVTLRTNKPSLVHALSDDALLLLDAEDVAQARDPNDKESRAKWLTGWNTCGSRRRLWRGTRRSSPSSSPTTRRSW